MGKKIIEPKRPSNPLGHVRPKESNDLITCQGEGGRRVWASGHSSALPFHASRQAGWEREHLLPLETIIGDVLEEK